jgi:hypothetical protein
MDNLYLTSTLDKKLAISVAIAWRSVKTIIIGYDIVYQKQCAS